MEELNDDIVMFDEVDFSVVGRNRDRDRDRDRDCDNCSLGWIESETDINDFIV